MSEKPTIVWFRADLRLGDNPALAAAHARGSAVIPVFIWAPEEEGAWPPGGASRWWLHHSLAALSEGLLRHDSRLLIRSGAPLPVLRGLLKETGADSVFWNRRYEPASEKSSATLRAALSEEGIFARSFNGSLLREPMELKTGTGKPYQVFTPFSRAHQALPPPEESLAPPKAIVAPHPWPASEKLALLNLLPTIPWDAGFRRSWTPGEEGARKAMAAFIDGALDGYDVGRDRPDENGTSRLSPHLHFGEISPRQVWNELIKTSHGHPAGAGSLRRYRLEILWREFANHLIHHFPQTPERPLRADFEKFPWARPGANLKAWQKGRTGYPIVDAGMRELWHTGWMHNRVRMIVASFLVKDLMIDWRLGAAWFWDTLVDADLANNTLGWQWAAGCGADAAPFFRIFNPTLQGEKFDPAGDYVRRWVPELAAVPAKWIHKPWQAPPEILGAAKVTLGKSYPAPIVDHGQAREAALAAFRKIRTP